MVMSKLSVQNIPGSDSSKVVKNIHNMPWLKKSAARKVSDHSEKAADEMYNTSTNMDNGERSGTKKKKQKRSKKPKKNNGNERMGTEIANKIAEGQAGNSKNAWSSDKNPVESLFPEAGNAARIMQLSEEEQIKLAMEASLETALTEKCVLDSPEPLEVEKDDGAANEDIWSGKCNNLPEPTSEEIKTASDANNNSGIKKTETSDMSTKKVEDEIVPSNNPTPKTEEAESEAKAMDDTPTDAQPNDVPYDQFGRYGGFSERHKYMGRGGRRREDDERRQYQQGPVNGSNQKQRVFNHGPYDPSRPRNPHASFNNENHGNNDRQNNRRRYPEFSDHQGPRNPHMAKNDSYKDHPRRFLTHGNSGYNTEGPYDSSKNPYKFVRGSNARGGYNRNEANSRRSNNEDINRHNNNTNHEVVREKMFPPLLPPNMEQPSTHSTNVNCGPRAIVGSAVEAPNENPPKIEAEVCEKKPEKPPEDEKPKFQMSDFNSRDKVPQEPQIFPTLPTSAPSSTNSSVKAEIIGDSEATNVPCQKNDIPIIPTCFSVPPPGFEHLESSKNPCNNTAYVVPIESSLRNGQFVLPAQTPHNCPAHTLPIHTPMGNFTDMKIMEEVYARIRIYDPNLYQLLQEKKKQDELERNAAFQGSPCTMIPANRGEIPTRSMEFPVEHRQPTLNPNANQYVPMSEQAWIQYNRHDSVPGYSAASNYDDQSMLAYNPETSQEMLPRNTSGWTSSQPTFHQDQTSQTTRDMTGTAILGRQNSLVSEQNFSIQTVQRPMNLPTLNDDYPRCQTSGYEHIPSNMQRQVQCPQLFPQYGITSHVCPISFAASGNNVQGMVNACVNCTNSTVPPRPIQNYPDFFNMMHIRTNQGNIEQGKNVNVGVIPPQGCNQREPNSIIQTERQFVPPMIQPKSTDKPLAGVGRGRPRMKKQ